MPIGSTSGLDAEIQEMMQQLFDGDALCAVRVSLFVYHVADSGDTYNVETGAFTDGAGVGSAPAATAPEINTDIQELLQDFFDGDPLCDVTTQTFTYSVANTGDIYNVETGSFDNAPGDGALWFDDEDNSHWLAWW